MDTIVSFLSYFGDFLGLDKGQVTFLVVLVGLYYFFVKPNFIQQRKSLLKLEKSMYDVKEKFSEAHNATREMQLFLKRKRTFSPLHNLEKLQWARSNSPYSLNASGEQLLKMSGIDLIILQNEDRILEILDERLQEIDTVTGYDIEKCALVSMACFAEESQEAIRHIKEFVYNHPTVDGREIDLKDIYFVGSLQIRDIYFKRHPELWITEEKK
mgnify:CR=1 FL=1